MKGARDMVVRKAEELAIPEDRQIVGDIAAWKMENGASIDRLAQLMGLSRRTMYNKIREPERFTLRECRMLYRIIGV